MTTVLGPDGAQHMPAPLPVTAMKTYAIASPGRPATCAEYRCRHYLEGWQTLIDEREDIGRIRAAYIRGKSGREFTEHRDETGMTVFSFPPGQQGFAGNEHDHRMPAEGAERFVIRDGDWRGNPTGVLHRVSPQGWTDDFGEHQERIAAQAERG